MLSSLEINRFFCADISYVVHIGLDVIIQPLLRALLPAVNKSKYSFKSMYVSI